MGFVAAEVKDRPTNANNRFQTAAKMNRLMTGEAFPFWGAPARDAQTTLSAKRPREHRDGDLPEFRYTDEAARSASVWKMYFQGSIGGQALTGMPMVHRLKAARGDGVKVWPFETGWRPLAPADVAGVEVLIAEAYAAQAPAQPRIGEVKDEAQARALVERFATLDNNGKLAPLFGPSLVSGREDARRAAVEREEGWALGVGF
jgi:hypothetical protein